MKDPAALFYIDTWLSATAEMDSDVRGWYLNLILHNYDKKDLPTDIEKLAVLAGVKFSEFERFKQVFEQVLKQKFSLNENNRLENNFAKTIISKRENFKDKREKSGSIGQVIKTARSIKQCDDDFIEHLKDTLKELNIDEIKKHMDKHLLKHLLKLYINGNGDGDKDINKDGEEIKTESENLKKHDLILWIESQAPRVQKLKNPITEEQAVRIVSKLEPELIKEIFYAMNNYKPLLSKYVDANQTFINWVKIRKEKSKGVTNVHSERSLKLLEIYVSEFNSFFKKQFDWQMYKHLCHRLEEIIKIKGLANCPKLFEKASKAIKKDDFHNRNGFMNVTPEYILRNDIFEKYLNQ